MPNDIIQKYFHRVLAWLRDLHVFKRAHQTYLLIKAHRLIRKERARSGLKNGFVYVLDPECKHVVQRAAMGEVNDDGTPKKIWITIRFHARESIDKFSR